MYIPTCFEELRIEELYRIMVQYPFGALIVNGPHGLDATHIPFEFFPQIGAQGALQAHVARANPVWRESKEGDDVLVIFRGENTYISPNWYPSKHEFHRQVPTWNYQIVHVHGKIKIFDDENFLRGIVARLTRTHEARAQESKPWKMGDSQKDYIDEEIAEIVGIEIEINKIIGVSKLSQNKDERDRASVINELDRRGNIQISTAMCNAVIKKP